MLSLRTIFNWKRLASHLKKETEKLTPQRLKVGFLATARYENEISVAKVAYANEYGTGKIPPRPFIRPVIEKNGDSYIESLRSILSESLDTKIGLSKLGMRIKKDIQISIRDVQDPPNAPSTIRYKNRKNKNRKNKKGDTTTNPLIDTGHMRRSVVYKIS